VLVAKGGFIEDKFGQQQAKWLEAEGFEAAHARYKTYLLPEPPLSAEELQLVHADDDPQQQQAAAAAAAAAVAVAKAPRTSSCAKARRCHGSPTTYVSL
jgi:hypothetical protein